MCCRGQLPISHFSATHTICSSCGARGRHGPDGDCALRDGDRDTGARLGQALHPFARARPRRRRSRRRRQRAPARGRRSQGRGARVEFQDQVKIQSPEGPEVAKIPKRGETMEQTMIIFFDGFHFHVFFFCMRSQPHTVTGARAVGGGVSLLVRKAQLEICHLFFFLFSLLFFSCSFFCAMCVMFTCWRRRS
jgi:hypothetical protein